MGFPSQQKKNPIKRKEGIARLGQEGMKKPGVISSEL